MSLALLCVFVFLTPITSLLLYYLITNAVTFIRLELLGHKYRYNRPSYIEYEEIFIDILPGCLVVSLLLVCAVISTVVLAYVGLLPTVWKLLVWPAIGGVIFLMLVRYFHNLKKKGGQKAPERNKTGWFRKKTLTPDECGLELWFLAGEVMDAMKSKFREEHPIMATRKNDHEINIFSLWIVCVCVPSKLLRVKLLEKLSSMTTTPSATFHRGASTFGYEFQKDLHERHGVYTYAYDKLRHFPGLGVEEFGWAVAQAVIYGIPPSKSPTNVNPHKAHEGFEIFMYCKQQCEKRIKRRKLVRRTIEKYTGVTSYP